MDQTTHTVRAAQWQTMIVRAYVLLKRKSYDPLVEKEWMQLSTNIALIYLVNNYFDSKTDVKILFECRHFQILRNKKGMVLKKVFQSQKQANGDSF